MMHQSLRVFSVLFLVAVAAFLPSHTPPGAMSATTQTPPGSMRIRLPSSMPLLYWPKLSPSPSIAAYAEVTSLNGTISTLVILVTNAGSF